MPVMIADQVGGQIHAAVLLGGAGARHRRCGPSVRTRCEALGRNALARVARDGLAFVFQSYNLMPS